MISVTSTTDKYILQPPLLYKHKRSVEWISAATLWKRELAFFQKLLEKYASKFSALEDRKKIDHFQSLITYYSGELVPLYISRLRGHEKKLAEMLELRDETKTEYITEHDGLMDELSALDKQFMQLKEEFFAFIERAM